MYARAQERMTQLRDMASRGIERLAAVGMPSSSSSSPGSGSGSGFGSRGKPGVGGSRPPPQASSASAAPSPARVAAVLAERLDAAAAAAEILFDMRASSVAGDATAEERETLTQLRVVCEEHLDVVAKTVEGGSVTNESLLVRAIEVAEQLVAAIGDDERAQGKGTGPRETTRERRPLEDVLSAPADVDATADLLGGLDVGGGGESGDLGHLGASEHSTYAPPEAPPGTPAGQATPHPATPGLAPGTPAGRDRDRPATEAEEEAMIAAAVAASLADAEAEAGAGAGAGAGAAAGAPAPEPAPEPEREGGTQVADPFAALESLGDPGGDRPGEDPFDALGGAAAGEAPPRTNGGEPQRAPPPNLIDF